MLIKELIQRVQSLYSRGVHAEDTRLSNRHIYNKLVSSRILLIQRRFTNGQNVSQWIYQDLPCVEMIKAPLIECPCVPKNGCYILKSKLKLPKPIVGLERVVIDSVTTLDGAIRLDQTTFGTVKNELESKYSGKRLKWYIRNEHLYITSNNYPELITVRGIFQDPLAYSKFTACGCDNSESDDCESFLDKEFVMDGDLIDALIELTNKELLEEFGKNREDYTNNARDKNEEKL